jgi:hypothetical protein
LINYLFQLFVIEGLALGSSQSGTVSQQQGYPR